MTAQQASSASAAFRLRVISVLETISFLALLSMMLTGNDTGVSIVGAIHGLLFLAYAVLVLRDRDEFGWSGGFIALAILTGPIGPIIVLEKLRRPWGARAET
jgi:integral membrane protein